MSLYSGGVPSKENDAAFQFSHERTRWLLIGLCLFVMVVCLIITVKTPPVAHPFSSSDTRSAR